MQSWKKLEVSTWFVFHSVSNLSWNLLIVTLSTLIFHFTFSWPVTWQSFDIRRPMATNKNNDIRPMTFKNVLSRELKDVFMSHFRPANCLNVSINVIHLYSALCIASEVLLVNHLYSAPSQGHLRQCRLGSNTTHNDCCHYRRMQERNPFGQPASQVSCLVIKQTFIKSINKHTIGLNVSHPNKRHG